MEADERRLWLLERRFTAPPVEKDNTPKRARTGVSVHSEVPVVAARESRVLVCLHLLLFDCV